MVRRGQVTVFIIIGIVIIGIIFLGIFLAKPKTKAPIDTSGDYGKLYYHANSCMETSAKEAVWNAFDTGFYSGMSETQQNRVVRYEKELLKPVDNSIYLAELIRPIYLDRGTSQMPTISNVEESIETSFNGLFTSCLISSDFDKQYEKFSYDDIAADVSIGEDSVTFSLNSRIHIQNGNSQTEVNSLKYILTYPIKAKYILASDFIKKQKNEALLLMGYLSYIAISNNLTYKITYLDNDALVFDFVYDDYKEIYHKELIHSFAVKFNWQ
jgi:hypothetical protein